MKIPPVKVKKNVPVKKILINKPFTAAVIEAPLGVQEVVILPPGEEPLLVNGRLKLTIVTRNKKIKKLEEALSAAHLGMQDFTERQEVLTEELIASNQALIIANHELVFQNEEKEKRAAELLIANTELAFQNKEKEKRAAELIIANKELAFQNDEKEKRAAELIIANKELVFQNKEKEKRAAELIVANKELLFQNEEKEKRATELVIANKELAFQNIEKERRAAELIVANKELAFQNKEKEKRAAELVIANHELAFQNEEKEKRAAELTAANKELEAFSYIASHDLQEPLRKIQTFSDRILEEDKQLSEKSKDYFQRMQSAAARMQQLILDLLAYSRTNITERKFEKTDLNIILDDIKNDLKDAIAEKHAKIETINIGEMNIIAFQFRQLLYNLISNALKFSDPDRPLRITISRTRIKGSELPGEHLVTDKKYCHLRVSDNGIGFESQYSDRIFEVFQKLHGRKEYEGTGIGLAIVKKIIENHDGMITASGELHKGATFDMYIPIVEE